jgi:uncharacterized membrane protein
VGYTNTSVENVNDLENNILLKENRIADCVVRIMGSWKFIITQTILLVLWSIVNIIAFFEHWDPYPFILLNLILSLQAAYAAPIIMMSQNRQIARDRIEAHNDYLINLKSEKEISFIIKHLESQNKIILELHHLLLDKEQEKTQSTG